MTFDPSDRKRAVRREETKNKSRLLSPALAECRGELQEQVIGSQLSFRKVDQAVGEL